MAALRDFPGGRCIGRPRLNVSHRATRGRRIHPGLKNGPAEVWKAGEQDDRLIHVYIYIYVHISSYLYLNIHNMFLYIYMYNIIHANIYVSIDVFT